MMKLSVAVLFFAALVGCSGGDSFSPPPVEPVSGTVNYKGSPVAGAVVQFVPTDSENGPTSASAKTDAQGKYTLSTTFTASTEVEGAMAGDYSVIVHKINLPAVPQGEAPSKDMSPEERQKFMAAQAQKMAGRAASVEPPKNELPEKYAKKATTTLEATVPAGGGTFDFTLED